MVKSWVEQIIGSKIFMKAISKLLAYPVAVFAYHDLCEDNDFSSWLRVKKGAFEAQVKLFKETCHFIRPFELFRKGALKKRQLNLLLAFDDGYVNNYKLAFPILKKHEIPGLFFVSTWNLQSGEPFWFDRIIAPIQRLGINSIDLRHLDLRDYKFYPSDGSKRWDSIQVLLEDIKAIGNPGHPRVQKIIQFFNDNFFEEIKNIIPSYRSLSEPELLEMKNSGLCFFASHSHRHENLTILENQDLRNTLFVSKNILEEITGHSIDHIGYPYGNADKRVKNMCREVGYRFGYLASPGIVGSRTDRMSIPRTLVGGYDSTQTIFWKLGKQFLYRAIRTKN